MWFIPITIRRITEQSLFTKSMFHGPYIVRKLFKNTKTHI